MSIENSHLLKDAYAKGFKLHHTNAKQEIVLSKWLSTKSPSKLPCYSSHNLGVGGLVFNHKRTKLLAIKENIEGFTHVWKFPGGLVDEGETIEKAAIREV